MTKNDLDSSLKNSTLHFAELERAIHRQEEEHESALRKNNLSLLLANMIEGFAVGEPILDEHGTPVDFRFLDANPAFIKHSGLSRDILGRPIREILPNLETFWVETYGQVALEGQPVKFTRFNQDTGKYFEVSCYSPEKGLFAILFQDITPQKQVENEIRNAALFPEENPSPVLRVETNGTLLFANRAATELLNQWHCQVGSEVPAFVKTILCKALDTGKNRELEVRCGERDLSFILVPLSERGYVNLYGRDITRHNQDKIALQKSEERLKRAQEISHLGSWELDLEDNRLTWSEEVYRIFGLPSAEFAPSYEDFLNVVHPDDRDAVHAAYTMSLHDNLDSYEIEHRIIRRTTGEIRYVHEKCEHIRNGNGRIVQSLGMVHDITEHKNREAEIQRLNRDLEARAKELEAANRELEAFNFTVAHDLRKPLTIINSNCQVLQELTADKLDEQGLAFLQDIQRGTVRMSQLIDALLDFSRLSHTELKPEVVDLSLLVHSSLAELHLADPERRITKRVSDGVEIYGDSELLQVVIANLIGNAWKFTACREAGHIEFGSAEIDGEAVYYVKDNGSGFAMADAESLFTPFQRLKGSESTSGFGIGLATVERIIQRHGGRVWAESEPGCGATFYFSLDQK